MGQCFSRSVGTYGSFSGRVRTPHAASMMPSTTTVGGSPIEVLLAMTGLSRATLTGARNSCAKAKHSEHRHSNYRCDPNYSNHLQTTKTARLELRLQPAQELVGRSPRPTEVLGGQLSNAAGSVSLNAHRSKSKCGDSGFVSAPSCSRWPNASVGMRVVGRVCSPCTRLMTVRHAQQQRLQQASCSAGLGRVPWAHCAELGENGAREHGEQKRARRLGRRGGSSRIAVRSRNTAPERRGGTSRYRVVDCGSSGNQRRLPDRCRAPTMHPACHYN